MLQSFPACSLHYAINEIYGTTVKVEQKHVLAIILKIEYTK